MWTGSCHVICKPKETYSEHILSFYLDKNSPHFDAINDDFLVEFQINDDEYNGQKFVCRTKCVVKLIENQVDERNSCLFVNENTLDYSSIIESLFNRTVNITILRSCALHSLPLASTIILYRKDFERECEFSSGNLSRLIQKQLVNCFINPAKQLVIPYKIPGLSRVSVSIQGFLC